MKYRALIFDFDGTIADTLGETRRIFNELAPDYGIRQVEEHEIHGLRHLSLKQILAELKIPKRRVPSIIARGTGMMRANIDRLELIGGMKDALTELGVTGLTAIEAKGFGRQKGHTEIYRGSEYTVDFLPKTVIETVVDDALAEQAVAAIVNAAKTGKIGDGKVFVLPVESAVRIRTEEQGGEAL